MEGDVLLFTSIDSSEKNEEKKMCIDCKKTITGRQKEELNRM